RVRRQARLLRRTLRPRVARRSAHPRRERAGRRRSAVHARRRGHDRRHRALGPRRQGETPLMRAVLILLCAGCYDVNGLSRSYDLGVPPPDLSGSTDDLSTNNEDLAPIDLDNRDAAVDARLAWRYVGSGVNTALRALPADVQRI